MKKRAIFEVTGGKKRTHIPDSPWNKQSKVIDAQSNTLTSVLQKEDKMFSSLCSFQNKKNKVQERYVMDSDITFLENHTKSEKDNNLESL